MSIGLILIILFVILLLGGFSGRFGGYGYGFGHGGVGILGVILIVLLVLLLMGRLSSIADGSLRRITAYQSPRGGAFQAGARSARLSHHRGLMLSCADDENLCV